jgi:DNA-binding NtrC family response regulator
MLRLPPLRNRRDDIPALVDAILTDLVKRHSLPHKPHMETAALEQLSLHEWKGNVRELRNVLEQLAVLAFAPGAMFNGTITADAVYAAINAQQGYEWDHEQPLDPRIQFAIEPAKAASASAPGTELALIYRALLELRSDISEIKQALQLNGHATAEHKALPSAPMNEYSDLNIEAHENRLIEEALARFDGDRAKAASALGISERTLYRKIRAK